MGLCRRYVFLHRPMFFRNTFNLTERGFQTMSTKSAALEKEMKVRTAKPNKRLRF